MRENPFTSEAEGRARCSCISELLSNGFKPQPTDIFAEACDKQEPESAAT